MHDHTKYATTQKDQAMIDGSMVEGHLNDPRVPSSGDPTVPSIAGIQLSPIGPVAPACSLAAASFDPAALAAMAESRKRYEAIEGWIAEQLQPTHFITWSPRSVQSAESVYRRWKEQVLPNIRKSLGDPCHWYFVVSTNGGASQPHIHLLLQASGRTCAKIRNVIRRRTGQHGFCKVEQFNHAENGIGYVIRQGIEELYDFHFGLVTPPLPPVRRVGVAPPRATKRDRLNRRKEHVNNRTAREIRNAFLTDAPPGDIRRERITDLELVLVGTEPLEIVLGEVMDCPGCASGPIDPSAAYELLGAHAGHLRATTWGLVVERVDVERWVSYGSTPKRRRVGSGVRENRCRLAIPKHCAAPMLLELLDAELIERTPRDRPPLFLLRTMRWRVTLEIRVSTADVALAEQVARTWASVMMEKTGLRELLRSHLDGKRDFAVESVTSFYDGDIRLPAETR